MNKIIDFKKITQKKDIKKELEKEKSIFIYSETSLNKNNISLDNSNLICYSTSRITKEKDKIDSMFKSLDEVKKIISFGGGTATDIGKYLSNKYNIPLIAIPSMLSTNAYATNKVALIIDNKVKSIDATTPTTIYLDTNILNNSTENNLYGLVDIFSIYTALRDWNLAVEYNNESKSEEYNQAKKLLKKMVDYVSRNDIETIEKDVEFAYTMIGDSGLITNKYGSGKPESGSEHIFAKALEKEINIPHAVSVTNGMILMIIAQSIVINNSILDENDIKVINSLKKLNMYALNKKYHVTYELVEKVFKKLVPREDRYSVVNLIYKDNTIKEEVLKKYKKIMEENI